MDIFEATRSFLQEVLADKHATWYPVFPLQWRMFQVGQDEMVLEHLSQGAYLSIEVVAAGADENDSGSYSTYFRRLEDMWRDMYPLGGIHHGKPYGYGSIPGIGDPKVNLFPFQDDDIVESIYSETVRANFIQKMQEYDPSGTFRAGSGLRMLGLTDKKYTPKQFVGDSCELFQDGQCISGCCQSSVFLDDQCIPARQKKTGESCNADCECMVDTSGDPCRWEWTSWDQRCRD